MDEYQKGIVEGARGRYTWGRQTKNECKGCKNRPIRVYVRAILKTLRPEIRTHSESGRVQDYEEGKPKKKV